MDNPFQTIDARLSNIENLLLEIKHPSNQNQVPVDEKKPLRLIKAAEYIGKAPTSLYTLVSNGQIKGYKAGKHWIFFKSDLDSYIKGGPIPSEDPSTFLLKRKKAEK